MTGDFTGFPDTAPASAPDTGPFPFRRFLEVVWNHRDDKTTRLHTTVQPDGALALEVADDLVSLAGQENLTDYHSPVGTDPTAVIASALKDLGGMNFRFDSLPREAADAVTSGLVSIGASFTESEHEVAAVLSLPGSTEEWLSGIGKKERHEVRRKRRRFELEFGEIDVVRAGVDALETFVSMHRTSPGDKASFMTQAMESFFADLITDAGAVIHLLVCRDRPLAAAFGFEDEDGYFYYNSALDNDAAHASPGIVLLTAMIDHEIQRGAKVFDFLKGDESYKFRHGAHPRQLYVLEGVLP